MNTTSMECTGTKQSAITAVGEANFQTKAVANVSLKTAIGVNGNIENPGAGFTA